MHYECVASEAAFGRRIIGVLALDFDENFYWDKTRQRHFHGVQWSSTTGTGNLTGSSKFRLHVMKRYQIEFLHDP